MSRPGPLQDWPLTQALAPDFHAGGLPSSSKRPNKRPRSPGARNLVSPAKRRILSQEGLYSPKKPSLLAKPYPSSPIQALSFGHDPTAPSSFGTKPAAPQTPKKPTANQEIDDYFSSPVTTPSSSKRTADPAALHYPGFDVFFDPDCIVPLASFVLPPSPPSPTGKSAQKENQKPKRPQGKKNIFGKQVPEIRVHDEHSHPMFGVIGMNEALAKTEKTESELQNEEWARRRADEEATSFVTLSLTGRHF